MIFIWRLLAVATVFLSFQSKSMAQIYSQEQWEQSLAAIDDGLKWETIACDVAAIALSMGPGTVVVEKTLDTFTTKYKRNAPNYVLADKCR